MCTVNAACDRRVLNTALAKSNALKYCKSDSISSFPIGGMAPAFPLLGNFTLAPLVIPTDGFATWENYR